MIERVERATVADIESRGERILAVATLAEVFGDAWRGRAGACR